MASSRGADGSRVPENTVGHAGAQGLDDRRGHLEVHVGDPHRQHVAAGILLPFLGVCASAVGRRVEIERHWGAERTISPGGFRTFFAGARAPRPGSGRLEKRQDAHSGDRDEALVGDPDLGDDGEGYEVEAHVGEGASGRPPRSLEPRRASATTGRPLVGHQPRYRQRDLRDHLSACGRRTRRRACA